MEGPAGEAEERGGRHKMPLSECYSRRNGPWTRYYTRPPARGPLQRSHHHDRDQPLFWPRLEQQSWWSHWSGVFPTLEPGRPSDREP